MVGPGEISGMTKIEPFDCEFSRTEWFGEDVVWLAPDPDMPFRELPIKARIERALLIAGTDAPDSWATIREFRLGAEEGRRSGRYAF